MSTDYMLAYGTHATPDDGRCAMEWVSYLAGEPHGDQPACVSPVLRAFCTTLNDNLDDGPRQRLRPYLVRTIGTADDGLDEARSWMAMDWLVRSYAARWLTVAGLARSARLLEELPAIVDVPELEFALVALALARRDTRAAWSAALGAARPVAWTPWAAGRAAAREAAWASAGAAAWAAARLEVGEIAGDRARASAREIAGDAAASLARTARAGAERAAARDAARAALVPTLQELQRSAFALLDRMLPTAALTPSVADDADRAWRSDRTVLAVRTAVNGLLPAPSSPGGYDHRSKRKSVEQSDSRRRASVALGDWAVGKIELTHVNLPRPDRLLFGVLDHLEPLGDPARAARHREHDWEHRCRHADRRVR